MRYFAIGTGRVGSVTFSRACHYIDGYTAAHETHNHVWRGGSRGEEGSFSLEFPDMHIESDPKLTILLPLLVQKYPGARFIHLVRPRDACIASLSKRSGIRDFAAVAFRNRRPDLDMKEAATLFYDNTNLMIPMVLREPYCVIDVTDPKPGLTKFWEWGKFEGDFDSALGEYEVDHNADKI